jgi:hypothetical protein
MTITRVISLTLAGLYFFLATIRANGQQANGNEPSPYEQSVPGTAIKFKMIPLKAGIGIFLCYGR